MTTLSVQYEGGGASISDPEFVQCLFNIEKVAVDGDTFHDVTKVTFTDNSVDLSAPDATTGDTVQFAEDDGTYVAMYDGRAGNRFCGIGDDRAAALRSLADNLDPFVEEDDGEEQPVVDGETDVEQDVVDAMRTTFKNFGEAVEQAKKASAEQRADE